MFVLIDINPATLKQGDIVVRVKGMFEGMETDYKGTIQKIIHDIFTKDYHITLKEYEGKHALSKFKLLVEIPDKPKRVKRRPWTDLPVEEAIIEFFVDRLINQLGLSLYQKNMLQQRR